MAITSHSRKVKQMIYHKSVLTKMICLHQHLLNQRSKREVKWAGSIPVHASSSGWKSAPRWGEDHPHPIFSLRGGPSTLALTRSSLICGAHHPSQPQATDYLDYTLTTPVDYAVFSQPRPPPHVLVVHPSLLCFPLGFAQLFPTYFDLAYFSIRLLSFLDSYMMRHATCIFSNCFLENICCKERLALIFIVHFDFSVPV